VFSPEYRLWIAAITPAGVPDKPVVDIDAEFEVELEAEGSGRLRFEEGMKLEEGR